MRVNILAVVLIERSVLHSIDKKKGYNGLVLVTISRQMSSTLTTFAKSQLAADEREAELKETRRHLEDRVHSLESEKVCACAMWRAEEKCPYILLKVVPLYLSPPKKRTSRDGFYGRLMTLYLRV